MTCMALRLAWVHSSQDLPPHAVYVTLKLAAQDANWQLQKPQMHLLNLKIAFVGNRSSIILLVLLIFLIFF